MKCHYEVLEVSRDADEAEIKTAYRKLALKWHPDKNLDNVDFAKEQFQIVQQAYDVLSDRQERAWYDNHREQIIRGASSEFEDKSLDVFQYFTATCFKGYNDDEDGFYTVYRDIFEKLAKEDMEFMDDKEEFCNIPSFGYSESSPENVSEFYAYWLNYSTKKSYVWLDPYDIKDIRDRRYIKMVEKENKKIRQKARKERNDEIRALAAFVRKRDKRVVQQKKLQEQKLLENKMKRESLNKQKRLERQRELANAAGQPEWAKFDNVKSELEEIEKTLAEQFGEELSNSEDEEEEEDINDLYCVVCSKLFKTPKAFQNHESSKKHKENVEIMRQTMIEEDEDETDLEEEENESDLVEDENECDLVEDENECDLGEDEKTPNELEESDELSDKELSTNSKSKKNKKKRGIKVVLDEEIVEELPINIETCPDEDNFDFPTNKNQKKKNKRKPKTKNTSNVQSESMTDTPDIKVENGNNKTKDNRVNKKDKTSNNIQELDLDHNCVTCKSNFSSKNKLFDHLVKTGHGVYIPPTVKNKPKKKSLR
ncbi:unnamed protein product [Phyllotreta striolata]|uniref:DnaJ homolog subfamily C member 21 n=1 Tax=Phyllotreta striolata TaxID=444603 RepID=A0A9N9XNV7_PHYSR|nr:unnamed protein product [Phyllotreta striolata]